MSEAQHTPLPWVVMPSRDNAGTEGVYVMGDTDVCDLYTYKRDEHGIQRDILPFENAKANAAFIVKACNAYEKLVDAIKSALCDLSKDGCGGDEPGSALDICDSGIRDAFNTLRAAIELAEG